MRGEATVPVEWFGELVPRVGDSLDLVISCRVSKIEQEQIDVSSWEPSTRGDTLGGETHVTLVVEELKMPLTQLEKLV